MTLTFVQSQELRALYAAKVAADYQAAEEYFARQWSHGLGRPYFWDLPAAQRRAVYAMHPPVLMDGSVPGPGPLGEWDWLALSQEQPLVYARYVQDFGRMLERRLENGAA